MTLAFTKLTNGNYINAFRVQERCHSHPWSEAVFKDCLTSPYFSFQMHDVNATNSLVGYYVGLAVAGEATLMDIGIQENHRGKGFAKPLMQHFFEQCSANGCYEAWLEVRESNQAAIGLYRKLGFEQIEIRKNYYPTESGRENGLIMQCKW